MSVRLGWIGEMASSARGVRVGWIAGRLVALGLALAMTGCAARPKATDPATDYVALYASGQYQAAFEQSSNVAASMRSYDRTKAALIAGLSAQALDRGADAKRFLTPLLSESDASVSGKAAAALGLMAQQHGEHAEASRLLASAAEKLLNDDKARAAMYAGDSFRALGKLDDAQKEYLLAQQTIRDEAGLRLLVGDRLVNLRKEMAAAKAPSSAAAARAPETVARVQPPAVNPRPAERTQAPSFEFQAAPAYSSRFSRFTVQTGAYASWNSAVAKAGEMDRYGKARIVEIRDPFGRRLYTVRLGSYSTLESAEAFRAKLGRTAVVVPSEQ